MSLTPTQADQWKMLVEEVLKALQALEGEEGGDQ